MAPGVAREFERLHHQLAEQEARATDLRAQGIAKVRAELMREEDAANHIRHRLQAEAMNGVAALNPRAVHPALLAPPGAYAPHMPQPMPPRGPWPPPGPGSGPRPPPSQRQLPMPPPRPRAPPQELHFHDMAPEPPEAAQQPLAEEDAESQDDPDTRHEEVKRRCEWLYLKGRLEGFEVLRPDLVFDGVEPPPGTHAASLPARNGRRYGPAGTAGGPQARQLAANQRAQAKEELDELYRESMRRMQDPDAALPRRPGADDAAGLGSEACKFCRTPFEPGARFCRKCGRPRDAESGFFPSQPSLQPQSPSRSEPVVQALKALDLQDADGSHCVYQTHRSLEPERRPIFASAFPECAEPNQVYEIVAHGRARDSAVSVKEFTAVMDPSSPTSMPKARLVNASCMISMEDMTPSECVEYTFEEEPDRWRMAQISQPALKDYKDTKFESWNKMLHEPDCEAQFRRMLQVGPVTRIYDPHVFPTPEAHKSQYQVTNEETGRLIDVPHPVSRLRIWDAARQRYEAIDPHLTGAPSEAEKESWWSDKQKELGQKHGDDYITGLKHGHGHGHGLSQSVTSAFGSLRHGTQQGLASAASAMRHGASSASHGASSAAHSPHLASAASALRHGASSAAHGASSAAHGASSAAHSAASSAARHMQSHTHSRGSRSGSSTGASPSSGLGQGGPAASPETFNL